MKKVMHPISVATSDEGNILLSQALNDINEPDPEILISPEQAPLVVSWLLEAGQTISTSDVDSEEEGIPVRFFARGPEADSENLSVYNNIAGMIILKIDDDTFIEVSPSMAKRLRDQLSKAIRTALTDMLRPDAEA
jgi:hypothetical protein